MDVPLYIAQATLLVVVYRRPADLLSANADNVEMVLVVAIQGTETPIRRRGWVTNLVVLGPSRTRFDILVERANW